MNFSVIEYKSEQSELSMPAGIQNWIDHQNSFINRNVLRLYQKNLAVDGHFSIKSPENENLIECSGTIYLAQKAFVWRFICNENIYWITSSAPTRAYEITGIFIEGKCEFICGVANTDISLIEQQIQKIEIFSNCKEDQLVDDTGGIITPAMVLGHPNFAHFAWNELPSLLELEEFSPTKEISILVTWEPIAPFEQMVRLSRLYPIQHISDKDLLGKPAAFHKRTLFTPGSMLTTTATKQRLSDVCGPATHNQHDRLVIWLSLRLMYRHGVNELEAWSALLVALQKLPYKIEVILDGYSIPDDAGYPHRGDFKSHAKRATDVANLAERLIENFKCQNISNVMITDATRFSLRGAISIAHRANFYVCHHGTQQHKIGWFHNVPGVIHAPPYILKSLPGGWVQAQSQDSIFPDYIPIDLVETDKGRNERSGQYDSNYYFPDIPRLIQFILEKITVAASSWAQFAPENRILISYADIL